jgi:hypothetical protein
VIADLTEVGQRVLLAKGGNGGWGNLRFKTSTNQAPRRANPGQEGVERTLWLRLKLIADAGLVGLPNAGKSTFLAATSNARPKIADYPFTTLHPNLGVVGVDGREFVMADIPGLIEGASEGRGLGDQFLGHVERCAVLLHLVDGTSEDVAAISRHRPRAGAYGGGGADKPRIVALNKIDALDAEELRRGALAALEARAGGAGLRCRACDGRGRAARCCARSGPRSSRRRRPAPAPAGGRAVAALSKPGRPCRPRGGWWSRSARRCWSMRPRRAAEIGLAGGLAEDVVAARAGHRGGAGLLGLDRAGARVLGCRPGAGAGAEPGRRGGRPDPAGPRL